MKPQELSMCLQGLARLGVQPPRPWLETAELTVLAMLPSTQQAQQQQPALHQMHTSASQEQGQGQGQPETAGNVADTSYGKQELWQQGGEGAGEEGSGVTQTAGAHEQQQRQRQHKRAANDARFVAGALYGLARMRHDASDALLQRSTLLLLQQQCPAATGGAHARAHTHTHTQTHTHTHTHTRKHTHTHTHTRKHTHGRTNVHVYMPADAKPRNQAHMFMLTDTNTYTHVHTIVRMCMQTWCTPAYIRTTHKDTLIHTHIYIYIYIHTHRIYCGVRPALGH